MALKALMLRKKIDIKKKEIEALRAKNADFETREAELEAAISEAESEEEQATVSEEIETFNAEKATHETALSDLEKEVGELETELAAEETRQDTTPAAQPAQERSNIPMATPEVRGRFGLTDEIVKREHVQTFLTEVRTCIKEKRALTNVGLTIPDEYLGMIKENVENYSKLYKYVTVRRTSGDGRQVIMGTIPEAIWTEMCGRLNELDLLFNDVEVEGNKLGGFFAVCNAILEDSDINLSAELINAISKATGLALDKAILYGTGTKMPEGVVTRLAQTEEPSDYPATAREWQDLHTTHILKIGSSVTGLSLFQTLLLNTGVIKGKYSNGKKVWCMSDTTYNYLKAQGMSINAAGAIVSGMEGTMPVIGGNVETLDFIPDYNIIGGYFDEYLLAERAGIKIEQSKECRFLDDQTVFKGTSRYDGVPVIAEGFAVIGVNGTDPTTELTFAPDEANQVNNIVITRTFEVIKVGETATIKAKTEPIDAAISYVAQDGGVVSVSDKGVVTGLTDGATTVILSSGDATAFVNIEVEADV